jgi:hypothetical protein
VRVCVGRERERDRERERERERKREREREGERGLESAMVIEEVITEAYGGTGWYHD